MQEMGHRITLIGECAGDIFRAVSFDVVHLGVMIVVRVPLQKESSTCAKCRYVSYGAAGTDRTAVKESYSQYDPSMDIEGMGKLHPTTGKPA